ncbi:hypothetical protein QAD02_008184 [Eretmocerus hayati]|uniref:Uncharacterized protein n=1 Tax=Eretmocerus hayati TaxID=131215 RepID=A0ACC2N860_9HYME|nr:hypothetical protein QAD02_008184 [Eretmocerus hayati]
METIRNPNSSTESLINSVSKKLELTSKPKTLRLKVIWEHQGLNDTAPKQVKKPIDGRGQKDKFVTIRSGEDYTFEEFKDLIINHLRDTCNQSYFSNTKILIRNFQGIKFESFIDEQKNPCSFRKIADKFLMDCARYSIYLVTFAVEGNKKNIASMPTEKKNQIESQVTGNMEGMRSRNGKKKRGKKVQNESSNFLSSSIDNLLSTSDDDVAIVETPPVVTAAQEEYVQGLRGRDPFNDFHGSRRRKTSNLKLCEKISSDPNCGSRSSTSGSEDNDDNSTARLSIRTFSNENSGTFSEKRRKCGIFKTPFDLKEYPRSIKSFRVMSSGTQATTSSSLSKRKYSYTPSSSLRLKISKNHYSSLSFTSNRKQVDEGRAESTINGSSDDTSLDYNIDVEQFNLEDVKDEVDKKGKSIILGKGTFGEVRKVKWHGTTYALKKVTIKYLDIENMNILREIAVMARLRHKNNVYITGCNITEEYCYILMEFVDGQDLGTILFGMNKVDMNDKDRVNWILQLTSAVQYLHHGLKNPVIHRDIKPENILISRSQELKLCDFGFGKVTGGEPSIMESQTPGSELGTVMYLPPEVILLNQKHSTKSDVWSTGLVAVEIYKGRRAESLRQYRKERQLCELLENQKIPDLSSIHDKNMKNALLPCFEADPDERCTIVPVQDFFANLMSSLFSA